MAQQGQKIAGKNHLNILREQVSTEVEIKQLMAGGTRGRQAPRQRNKDVRIKVIVDNFDNYRLSNSS